MAHGPARDGALRAVLWDVDGTLVDSQEMHWEAWHEALRKAGVAVTHEQFLETFGWRNDAILAHIAGPDLSPGDVVEISEAKETAYRAAVRTHGIDLLPGAGELLAGLDAAGWRQVIASSAPRANVDTILDVTGTAATFAAVVSAEDVAHGKPDPEIFLTAAARVGVPPAGCVVVEDAPAGVEGARRAGVPCIGVRTTHDELAADIVVDSLTELSVSDLQGL
ncbi:MAG: HAD family phosphatase [Acidimicrobiia bacterium]|nr:HAD family phosphatase [Acidimicrobiia bacterium]